MKRKLLMAAGLFVLTFLMVLGIPEEEKVSACSHNNFSSWTTYKAATCTSNRVDKRTCQTKYCYYSETKEISGTKLGHSMGTWITDKAANCTQGGTRHRNCNRSGCNYKETENISAKGHSWGGWYTSKEPTCTAKGTSTRKCSTCSITENNEISALNHSFSSYNVTVQPTCTSEGKKVATCSRSYCYATDTVSIPATGHSYSGVTDRKEATCTEDGYTAVLCNKCGNVGSKTVIKAKGHSWMTESEVKKATCTEDGAVLQRCSVCGAKQTATVKAPGKHTYNSSSLESKPATCTEDGYNAYRCTVCGLLGDKNVIPAKGHNWQDESVVKGTSCTEESAKLQVCSVCGAKQTVVVPSTGHHTFSTEPIEPVPATCTEEGYTGYRCLVCGVIGNKTVTPAKGHVWEDKSEVKKTTCTEDGAMLQVCKVCGANQTITVKAIGQHNFSGVKKTVDATCTEDGYTGIICNNCGVIGSKTTIKAKGHTWVDKYVKKDPTSTKDGVMVQVCTVCDAEQEVPIKATGKQDGNDNPKDDPVPTVNPENKEEPVSSDDPDNKKEPDTKKDPDTQKDPDGKKDTDTKKDTGADKDSKQSKDDSSTGKETSGKSGDTGSKKDDGHIWQDMSVVKKAGCTTDGAKLQKCKECGAMQTVTIPPTGHSYSGVVKKKASTCIRQGGEGLVCNNCGEFAPGYKIYPLADHVYSEWEKDYDQSTDDFDVFLRHCTTPGCTTHQIKSEKVNKSDKKSDSKIETVSEFDNANTDYSRSVTFYPGDGSGEPFIQYFKGSEMDVPRCSFTKAGYKFDRWCTEQSGEYGINYRYYSKNNVDKIRKDSNVTAVYAIWTPIMYTVQFDINAYGEKNPWSVDVEYGAVVSLPIPERTGYEFYGWKGIIDGKQLFFSADSIKKDTPYINLTTKDGAIVKLSAEWSQHADHVSAKFYDGDKLVEQYELNVNEKKSMPTIKNQYGLSNIGWTTVKNGTEKEISVGKNHTFTKNETYYAVWGEYYEVELYDGDKLVRKIGGAKGSLICPSVCARKDKFNIGWATKKNGSVKYATDISYDLSGVKKLYAVWNTYTVSYNANGGKGAPESQTAEEGEAITLSKKVPTRTGYTFDHWSYVVDRSEAVFKPGDTYSAGTHTLTAIWKRNTYTIKYMPGYQEGKSESKKYTYGKEFSLKEFTRTGYEFLGWKGTAEGKQVYYSAKDVKEKKYSNLTSINGGVVTLTAQWKEKKDYCTVSFYDGDKKVKSVTVKKGKAYSLPNYEVNDIYINGWAEKKNGTKNLKAAGAEDSVTSDKKYYASWPKLTLKFDANGGSGAPKTIVGNATGIVIPDQVPTKEGVTFESWCLRGEKGYDTTYYQPGDIIYSKLDTITLHVIWTQNRYSPNKEKLQKDFPGVMKDEYFTQEYTSPYWQRINDHCFFIIKTWKVTDYFYETLAYVVYKDGDTVLSKEYDAYGGIAYSDLKAKMLEHLHNDNHELFSITMDFVEDAVTEKIEGYTTGVVKNQIEKGIKKFTIGKIYFTSKEIFDLAKKWAKDPGSGKTIFASLKYAQKIGKKYEMEFLCADDFPYGDYQKAVGYITKALNDHIDEYARANSDFDPYGDMDAAITTVSDRIKGDGFGSDIYDSGLRSLIKDRLYN